LIFDILTCAGNTWTPGLGDPTLLGWVTSFAYQLGAAASLLAWLRTRSTVSINWRSYRAFWLIAALSLFFLGINKQLDLQSGLTAIGRCGAQLSGWYGERRIVQAGFIAIIGVLAASGLIWGAMRFKPILGTCWLALSGLALLTAFVVMRAMSFHHMDAFIASEFAGLRLNGVIELSAIGAILANAAWYVTQGRVGGKTQGAAIRQDTLRPMDFS
jgi:hypothetical protein